MERPLLPGGGGQSLPHLQVFTQRFSSECILDAMVHWMDLLCNPWGEAKHIMYNVDSDSEQLSEQSIHPGPNAILYPAD